jgi:hypothetical protein
MYLPPWSSLRHLGTLESQPNQPPPAAPTGRPIWPQTRPQPPHNAGHPTWPPLHAAGHPARAPSSHAGHPTWPPSLFSGRGNRLGKYSPGGGSAARTQSHVNPSQLNWFTIVQPQVMNDRNRSVASIPVAAVINSVAGWL